MQTILLTNSVSILNTPRSRGLLNICEAHLRLFRSIKGWRIPPILLLLFSLHYHNPLLLHSTVAFYSIDLSERAITSHFILYSIPQTAFCIVITAVLLYHGHTSLAKNIHLSPLLFLREYIYHVCSHALHYSNRHHTNKTSAASPLPLPTPFPTI